MHHALSTAVLGSLLTATAGAQAAPEVSRLSIGGGTVSVRYHPVALPVKPLEEHQSPGTVWSMSDQAAAILETDIALAAEGTKVIPPGRHRLSTWFKKKGEWQLLVFSKGDNYKSGTPYRSFRVQYRDLPQAKNEMLRIEVVERRGAARLQLLGGTTRLRVTLEPLQVVEHKGLIDGRAATFEFYRWHANPRIQNRLREYHMVQFGRVRRDGPFGAVYDISCKSDGNGIFVMCHSTTLKDNRELLVQKTKQLHATPGDATLKRDIEHLQGAIAEQKKLQPSVMLPGTVELVKERARTLDVKPLLDSDGTAFELSFGLRKAKFTLNPTQFRKIDWK